MIDPIKEFWGKQAMEHGSSDLATAPDHYYRTLEISRIMPHLSKHATVLDVGCGNGYSTEQFAKGWIYSKFLGVDYSEEMIKEARCRVRQNLSFQVANVLDLQTIKQRFDIVISERCLINLASWSEQKDAIRQLKRALNPGGRLILVENTQEGLDNLNKLRLTVNLPRIKPRWHNSYLPQRELMPFLRDLFEVQHVENIGNLYYIISRVVYAKLAQIEGKEVEYNHPINEIAAQLPSLPGYQYSPNFMFVLRSI